MTVAENLRLAVAPEHLRRRDQNPATAMRSLLDDVHFLGHLEDRVSSLSVARRHLLELAKALAVSPRLLILDEPTAPLSQDSVELLFNSVRRLAATGTAVVYITHRLAEVREIADRVTVLRDGRLRGTSAVADISDEDLLALIIGRTLEATFPTKPTVAQDEEPLLRVEALSGHGFENLSFSARKGEIVGIAGVVGNGQTALLRALAGRASTSGSVNVAGEEFSRRARLKNAAYMPADRLTEGLMKDLNVRENSAMSALDALTVGPFVSPGARSSPSSDSCPSWLSGHRRSRRRSPLSPAETSRRSSWRGRCLPSRRSWSPTSRPRVLMSARARRSTGSFERSRPEECRSWWPRATRSSWKDCATG